MIYSIDISLDDIITEKVSDDLYLCNDFTLTVNAVNDAPVLLQSFEDLIIISASGAAAVVLNTLLVFSFN